MTAILIALALLAPCRAESKRLSSSMPANYVYALQTANSFLSAWVDRDEEAGRSLISRRLSSDLQKKKREGWFRDYMVGLSNPHHLSFEIGPGKTIGSKRLSFPVVLYEHYTGEPKAFTYKSKMEVVQDGDEWRVDVLPVTPDDE